MSRIKRTTAPEAEARARKNFEQLRQVFEREASKPPSEAETIARDRKRERWQSWKRDAHATFREIENLQGLTDADKAARMERALRATIGGALTAVLEGAEQQSAQDHKSGARAREGLSKKVDAWHAKADELAADLWARSPDLSSNRTAGLIYPELHKACPGTPGVRSVSDHLSKKKVCNPR